MLCHNDSVNILTLDLTASSERKKTRKITHKVMDSTGDDEILRIPKKKVKSFPTANVLERVDEFLRKLIVCISFFC